MQTLKRERSAQSPGPARCRTESEGKMGEIRMMERGGSRRARGTEVTGGRESRRRCTGRQSDQGQETLEPRTGANGSAACWVLRCSCVIIAQS